MEKRLDVSNSDMTRDILMSQCQSMASLFQAFRMWGLRKEMRVGKLARLRGTLHF